MTEERKFKKSIFNFLMVFGCILSFVAFISLVPKVSEKVDVIDSLKNKEIYYQHKIDSLQGELDKALELNDMKSIKTYIKSKEYAYPKLMIAVIKEESAYATSKLAKKNNNLAGMKLAKKRPTTAVGVKNGFAYYNSKVDSIEDLNIYFETYIVPKNLSRVEAAYYLERNYAKSKGYANRLLQLI